MSASPKGSAGPLGAHVFVDSENMFWPTQFYRDGEFEGHRNAALAAMATEPDHPVGHKSYPQYNAALGKEPTLEVIPKVVDYLVEWLNSNYKVRDAHTYGYEDNRGVIASRERFESKDGWCHVPTPNEPEAADKALIADLGEAAQLPDDGVIVLASSDAKTYLRDGSNGPITEAIQIVESVRRRRPGTLRELVVILAAANRSPDERRWRSRTDLGRADTVYRLSEIVAAAIESRRAVSDLQPRAALGGDRSNSKWKRRWKQQCAECARKSTRDLDACVRQLLGDAETDDFARFWQCFEDGLMWLTVGRRARLLAVAAPIAGQYASWKAKQRAVHARPHEKVGLATMPTDSLHAATPVLEDVVPDEVVGDNVALVAGNDCGDDA